MIRIGLLIALVFSSAAQAAEPVTLAPTTAWHVDYGEESCKLTRQFGKYDKGILFVMEKSAPGETFKITLAGLPLTSFRNKKSVDFHFGPTFDWQKLGYYYAKLDEDKPAIISSAGISFKVMAAQELKSSTTPSLTKGYMSSEIIGKTE